MTEDDDDFEEELLEAMLRPLEDDWDDWVYISTETRQHKVTGVREAVGWSRLLPHFGVASSGGGTARDVDDDKGAPYRDRL